MSLSFRTLIIVSIATLLSAAQTGFASDLGVIKMTIDDNDQMTINIRVNDQEGPAVLDTAATYALIDANMLTEVNSQPRDEQVEILGLSGRRLFPTTQIGPVMTGEIDLNSMPAAINSQTRFPGHKTILPASAFKSRVIDFDFPENRIELYDRRPKAARGSVLSKINYREIDGLPFIEVKLNGKIGLALIDTGSDATYINSTFAQLAGARPKPDNTIRLFGADSSGTRVSVMSAKRLQIGKHQMRNFLILSADPPMFEHLGLADQPIMVLGLDTLRNFRLQIDRERKRIVLARPEDPYDGQRRFRVQPFSSRIRPDGTG